MSDPRTTGGRRVGLIVGAFVLPIAAAFLSLVLLRQGPVTCPQGAIGPKNGLCWQPTNPPSAPSTVVPVPPIPEAHVSERVLIIGVSLAGSVVLLAFAARLRAVAMD
jgi:hypothetical protein